MDRNLIVSATLAAAIHAGLLFGIRPDRAETPPLPVKMKPTDDRSLRVEDPPPPPETNAGDEAPRPVAPPRTSIDEPPPTERD
ncbi:MAG: hypothetical protein NTV51_15635, partial [Verrucomicrobia bacterium]|nr:hypothetical protein [Verrucomicrobiota bacterium]